MNDVSLKSEPTLDELIGRLAEEFTQRLRDGEKPDVDQYATRYPRAAELIHQIFPALEVMVQADAASLDADSGTKPHARKQGVLGDYRIVREIGRGGREPIRRGRVLLP